MVVDKGSLNVCVCVCVYIDSASSGGHLQAGDGAPPLAGGAHQQRRRHINFEQIEAAIRQLVSSASSDVRAQYAHLLAAGAVNQSLMQRRVASELMLRLANSSANQRHRLDVGLRCAARA